MGSSIRRVRSGSGAKGKPRHPAKPHLDELCPKSEAARQRITPKRWYDLQAKRHRAESPLTKDEIRIKWLKKRHELVKLSRQHGVRFHN